MVVMGNTVPSMGQWPHLGSLHPSHTGLGTSKTPSVVQPQGSLVEPREGPQRKEVTVALGLWGVVLCTCSLCQEYPFT